MKSAFVFAAAGLAVMSLTSCSNSDAEADADGSMMEYDAPEAVNDPDWGFSNEVDPMNDMQVLTATRTYESGQFMVETAISCAGEGSLSYTFSTFFSDQAPANFKQSFAGGSGGHMGYFRLDGGDAILGFHRYPRFSNALEQRSAPVEWANAQRITAKLELENGDAVFAIDQDAPAVQAVLNHCVSLQMEKEAANEAALQSRLVDLRAEYAALQAIPENSRTSEQVRQMINLRGQIRTWPTPWAGIAGTPAEEAAYARARQREFENDPDRIEAETSRRADEARNRREADEEAKRNDAASRAASLERDNSRREQRQNEDRDASNRQAELCDQIYRTGAGNKEYERMMGC